MIGIKPQKLDNHTIIKFLLLFYLLKSRSGRITSMFSDPEFGAVAH